MVRNECCHEIRRLVVRWHGIRWTYQTVAKQFEKVRSIERNLLHSTDREGRQQGPYKWSSRRPSRNHQEPAVEWRVPKTMNGEKVQKKYHQNLNEGSLPPHQGYVDAGPSSIKVLSKSMMN